MKTHFTTLLCALLCGAAASANPIDETQANAAAEAFFTSQLQTSASQSSALSVRRLENGADDGTLSPLTLVLKKERTAITGKIGVADAQTSESYYYVYNRAGGGFVIVAGDDALPTILGYSLTGRFDASQMADGLTAYLAAVEAATENAALRTGFCMKETTLNDSALPSRVEALLGGIMWGQDYPYNKLTPGGSPVGCVATALSQVMRYYRWPLHSEGSHSYVHNKYGVLAVDYDAEGAYDYDLMPESGATTTAQADELSKLCYHVGVAVDMDYTATQSAAYMYPIPAAMTGNFKYARTLRYLNSTNVGATLFSAYIKQSIAEGCPVPFSGQTSTGSSSHAFVLDGYDDAGRFHVNWGWTGLNDGYYYITDMQGYNYYQTAVTGLRPDTAGTSVAGEVMLSGERVALTLAEDGTFSDISIAVRVYKSWSEERSVDAQFGLAAVSVATGDTVMSHYALTPSFTYASTETNSFNAGTSVALADGRYFSGLADGDYIVRIYALKADGSVELLPLYADEAEATVAVTISDGGTKWTLTPAATSNIALREGSVGYALNSTDAANFSFVLENSGAGAWNDSYIVGYEFLNTQEGSGSAGTALKANVKMASGASRQFNIAFPRYYFHAENYDKVKLTLTLCEGDERKTYDLTPGYVGVNAVSQHTLNVSVVGEGTCELTGVADPSAVPYLTTVGFMLTPAEGYVVGELRVDDKWADPASSIIIYKDTQVEARFEKVSSLQPTLRPADDRRAVLYDLQGRRVTQPQKGSLYVNGVGEKVLF